MTRLLVLGTDITYITDIQRFLGYEDIGATRIYAETSLAMLRRKFDQVTDQTISELLGAVRIRHGDVVGAFAADLGRRTVSSSLHLLMHEPPAVTGAESAVDRTA